MSTTWLAWLVAMITAAWRWCIRCTLLIYIVKFCDLAPYQGHIWELLNTWPNLQLSLVCPLPSHYLPWPTKYAFQGDEHCTVVDFLWHENTQGFIGSSVALTLILAGVTLAHLVVLILRLCPLLKSVASSVRFDFVSAPRKVSDLKSKAVVHWVHVK